MHGAQMVAFNMQGYGNYLWIMQGMFKANCGCGYLKRPDFLLERGLNDEVFDPNASLDVKTVMKVKITPREGWHQDFHYTPFYRCSPLNFYTRVRLLIFQTMFDGGSHVLGIILNALMPLEVCILFCSADKRVVPKDHDDSNYKLDFDGFLAKV